VTEFALQKENQEEKAEGAGPRQEEETKQA